MLDTHYALVRQPTDTWVFSDEAGVHGDARYFAIGMLVVRHSTPSGSRFGARLQEMWNANNWTDEFKWSQVSRGNVHRYRKFTSPFFAAPKTVQFHCVVVDRTLLTERSKARRALFQFYHLLLSHRLRPAARFGANKRSLLIPDRMDVPGREWDRLFHSANASLRGKHELRHRPLVACVPSDSKAYLEIQLADVLLGGVLASRNGPFLSEHKQALSAELVDSIEACGRPKASVWEWQPTAMPNLQQHAA